MTGEGQAVRLQDFGLEQLFWRLHEAMIVADAGSGRIVLWNPAAETLFGYSAAEAAGLIIDDLVPERLRDFARAGRARYAATGSGQHVDGTVIETVALHKTNGELPVELSYTPLSDSAVPGRFVLALIRGVADAGRNATVLYDSDERYRQIFATNQTVKLVIDPASGEIVDANQAAADFYGYSLEELKRMPLAALTDLSPEQLQADLALAAEEQRLYFLFRHRLASGQVRDVEVYSGPFDVRGRRLLYSVVHDITERKALEEQLRQHAFYDPLTALPNRALLMNRLDQALGSAGRPQGVVVILFLGLEGVKL
ncbi:MAG: PAS domain S-box protein, partial [Dehalococcoidia bacterium]